MGGVQGHAGAVPPHSVQSIGLPIEPLYASRVVAELVPFSSLPAMHQWLAKHKGEFPARYRRTGIAEHRMFTLSEIQRMRDMTIRENVDMSRRGRPRGRVSRNPAVSAVMRRASQGI